jgi:hypothetical protein
MSRNGNIVKATSKLVKGVNGDEVLTFRVDAKLKVGVIQP